MDLGLGGKTAIVTGGRFGHGQGDDEDARRGRRRGLDRRLQRPWRRDHGRRNNSRRGHGARAVAHDVTSRQQWTDLVARVLAESGKIDIICNVAGPGAKTGHLDTDDAEWNRQIGGHLTGVFLGCQTVLPHMIERKYGKIINMCSFTAHGIAGHIPGYGAAFGGILAYTKDLARFAAKHNINVNCVSPGNIVTPMTMDGWLEKPGAIDQLRQNTPIGRAGQPDDVAYWLAILASDKAQHAVGIEINVSGGQLLN